MKKKIDFYTQHLVNGVAYSFGINKFIITKCESGVCALALLDIFRFGSKKSTLSGSAVRSIVRPSYGGMARSNLPSSFCLFDFLAFLFDAAVALLFCSLAAIFFHFFARQFFLVPVPLCILVVNLWVDTLSDLETNLYLCELRYGRQ